MRGLWAPPASQSQVPGDNASPGKRGWGRWVPSPQLLRKQACKSIVMARITYSVTAALPKELSWRLKQKQENMSQVRPGSRLPNCSPRVRARTQTWHCQASLRACPARSLYLGLLSAHAPDDTPSRGPAAPANHKAQQPARLRGRWGGARRRETWGCSCRNLERLRATPVAS